MTSYFEYTISREPFNTQHLTELHWECYQAVRDKRLDDCLTEAKDDHFRLICLMKCLSELETIGLLVSSGQRMKYKEWRKRNGITRSQSAKSTSSQGDQSGKSKEVEEVVKPSTADKKPEVEEKPIKGEKPLRVEMDIPDEKTPSKPASNSNSAAGASDKAATQVSKPESDKLQSASPKLPAKPKIVPPSRPDPAKAESPKKPQQEKSKPAKFEADLPKKAEPTASAKPANPAKPNSPVLQVMPDPVSKEKAEDAEQAEEVIDVKEVRKKTRGETVSLDL